MEFGAFKMRLIVAALTLIGAFARAQNTAVSEFRLPTNFKPISYTLDVTTHLENKFAFEGIVGIRVSRPVDEEKNASKSSIKKGQSRVYKKTNIVQRSLKGDTRGEDFEKTGGRARVNKDIR